MADYTPRHDPSLRPDGDGLFGLAARATGVAAQIGLTLASAPLVLLPAHSRRHVRRAMAELARGAVALPKGVSAAVENLVDDIWSDADSATASDLNIGDRARGFANRVVNAADDINQGLGSFARRAGDAVERSAADLDAWAQGRPAPVAPVADSAKTVDDWVEKPPQ